MKQKIKQNLTCEEIFAKSKLHTTTIAFIPHKDSLMGSLHFGHECVVCKKCGEELAIRNFKTIDEYKVYHAPPSICFECKNKTEVVKIRDPIKETLRTVEKINRLIKLQDLRALKDCERKEYEKLIKRLEEI